MQGSFIMMLTRFWPMFMNRNVIYFDFCDIFFRNKKGQPLLLFKRNLINRRETLPFIIANEGSLISKVYIDLIDPDGVFTLVPTGESRAFITDGYDNKSK